MLRTLAVHRPECTLYRQRILNLSPLTAVTSPACCLRGPCMSKQTVATFRQQINILHVLIFTTRCVKHWSGAGCKRDNQSHPASIKRSDTALCRHGALGLAGLRRLGRRRDSPSSSKIDLITEIPSTTEPAIIVVVGSGRRLAFQGCECLLWENTECDIEHNIDMRSRCGPKL